MMRRLFWRIFAAFWVATVVVLVAFAWITTSNFETEKIPGLGITRLQAAMDDLLSRASRELRRDGEDETREWLQAAAGFGSIGIYVFDRGRQRRCSAAPGARDSRRGADVAAEAAQATGDGPSSHARRRNACAHARSVRATAISTPPWPRSKAAFCRA